MKRSVGVLLGILLSCGLLYGQECDRVTFDSHGSKVVGCMYPAESKTPVTLVFTQGFMDTGDIWGIGKTLSGEGINVFTFDFRGCFDSGGKQSLMNSQEDIEAALSFLSSDEMVHKYHIDRKKIVLGGYSYGGHMSMLYAAHHPEIRRVISVSGGDLGVLARLVRDHPNVREAYARVFRSNRRPEGPVDFAYDDPMQELLDHEAFFSIIAQAGKLSKTDILMTGGLDDRIVTMEDYQLPLYRALKKNSGQRLRFIVYQTNHSYRNASGQMLADLSTWIERGRAAR